MGNTNSRKSAKYTHKELIEQSDKTSVLVVGQNGEVCEFIDPINPKHILLTKLDNEVKEKSRLVKTVPTDILIGSSTSCANVTMYAHITCTSKTDDLKENSKILRHLLDFSRSFRQKMWSEWENLLKHSHTSYDNTLQILLEKEDIDTIVDGHITDPVKSDYIQNAFERNLRFKRTDGSIITINFVFLLNSNNLFNSFFPKYNIQKVKEPQQPSVVVLNGKYH
mgnify:CR=1 FL=1|uniref:Uncharacterized protein n=1 Tax=viral metagenome TaxID=1070528 RepID=A0A6C0CML2_9ZZZZ